MRPRSAGTIALAMTAVVSSAACVPSTGYATTSPGPADAGESSAQMLAMLDAVATDAESRMRPPRVWLRTHAPFRGSNRVDLSFGVTEDAYVLVGFVGRDGEMHVEFPARASAAHFVPGARVLELRNRFTGFDAPPIGSGLHLTRGAAEDYYRNTGYAFAIASTRPLDLDALEELGWWRTELARDLQAISPRLFAHRIASLIVAEGAEYSIDAVSLRTGSSTPLAYAGDVSSFSYSSMCHSAPYLSMEPWQAQLLIRQQLSYGCGVPRWAVERYLYPVGYLPPAGTPRTPVPPPDSSPLLRDGRPVRTQVRSHVADRPQPPADPAADRAAESQRLMMLRAEAMRREIREAERARAEAAARGPERRRATVQGARSESRPGRVSDPGSRESVRRQPAAQRTSQERPRREPAGSSARREEAEPRRSPLPGQR